MSAPRAVLLIAVLGLMVCCRPRAPSMPASLLPESHPAPGWIKTSPTRTFDAGDLWKYIDGDAEKYVRAGVQQTQTADYRYQNGTDAVVDVHVMATVEGAVQILDAEPAVGSRSLLLGDAARLYGASLVFRKGRCLVRIVAYRDTPETASGLVTLARAVEAGLGPAPHK